MLDLLVDLCTGVANVDDVRPQFQTGQNAYLSQNAIFQQTLVRSNGVSAGATINAQNGQPITAVSGMKIEAKPWYSDQILPFDVTLAGTSETGAATCMKIYGIEILNEGSGVSIDDAVTEMSPNFVFRLVEPWQDWVNTLLKTKMASRGREERAEGGAVAVMVSSVCGGGAEA